MTGSGVKAAFGQRRTGRAVPCRKHQIQPFSQANRRTWQSGTNHAPRGPYRSPRLRTAHWACHRQGPTYPRLRQDRGRPSQPPSLRHQRQPQRVRPKRCPVGILPAAKTPGPCWRSVRSRAACPQAWKGRSLACRGQPFPPMQLAGRHLRCRRSRESSRSCPGKPSPNFNHPPCTAPWQSFRHVKCLRPRVIRRRQRNPGWGRPKQSRPKS